MSMIQMSETTAGVVASVAQGARHKITSRNKLNNQSQSTYDAVFNCLKRLNNITLPRSMNRITTNGNVKIFLVKHKLIREIDPDNDLRAEYLTYRYYSIDLKG